MNIKHSAQFDDWHTPADIVEAARTVLGGIDFDPASDSFANSLIAAKEFYDAESLERQWVGGSIFLNPPGGKIGNKSQAALFWKKLMWWTSKGSWGLFTHAIFVGFSMEILQVSQLLDCPSVGDFLCCIPKRRIKFQKLGSEDRPSHANVIAYVPGSVDRSKQFSEVFSDFGIIITPYNNYYI